MAYVEHGKASDHDSGWDLTLVLYGTREERIRACRRLKKKIIMAQLGVEPRSPTLCLKSAGLYVAGVLPLDYCAFLYNSLSMGPYNTLCLFTLIQKWP